jgi:hypothetical protein
VSVLEIGVAPQVQSNHLPSIPYSASQYLLLLLDGRQNNPISIHLKDDISPLDPRAVDHCLETPDYLLHLLPFNSAGKCKASEFAGFLE